MRKIFAFATALGLSILLLVGAASANPGAVTFDGATRSNGRLSFTVTTPGGPLLTSHDFSMTVNDIPAEDLLATPLQKQQTPAGAVVLIDTSGSMSGKPISEARKAVHSFASSLQSGSQVALVNFSASVTVLSDYTSNTGAITAKIPRLTAHGETALYDGLVKAASLTGGVPKEQRNIILLTDGADTVSKATLKKALSTAKASGVTVFAVVLKSPDYTQKAGNVIQSVTKATGGRVLATSNAAELSRLFTNLAQTLATSYRVTVRDPDPSASLVQTSIRVRQPGGAATGSDSFALAPSSASAAGSGTHVLGLKLPLPLVLLLVFLTFGIGFFVLSDSVLKKHSPADRVGWYANPDFAPEDAESAGLINAKVLKRAQDLATALAHKAGLVERIDKEVQTAGLKWRAGEILVASGAMGIVAGFLGWTLWGKVMGAFFLLLGFMLPILYVKRKAKKRRKDFFAQLPDILLLMSGALRAGFSLQQAIQAVAQDAKPPASEEFRRTVSEVRLGSPLGDALDALSDRLGIIDFEWTVLAIQIQREVGGNLAEILEIISETIRERERLRRQISTLTAEGKLSAYVLGCLPFAMGGLLMFQSPDYLTPLFHNSMGLIMIAGGLVGMVIGGLWMRQIINIEV
jgi:tight adherence protein B